jgi:hypothetical protein
MPAANANAAIQRAVKVPPPKVPPPEDPKSRRPRIKCWSIAGLLSAADHEPAAELEAAGSHRALMEPLRWLMVNQVVSILRL